MKKGRFAGLVYRELYLCRKDLITSLVMFAGFAFLGFMLLLSFYYGNVGKILASILADGRGDALPDAQEVYERMRSGLFFAMKLSPELMIMGIAFSATNITAKDTKVSWLRYEHCTPVTPLRYSAVRTTVNVILTAASAAIGILYMFLIGLISGEGLVYRELSLLMLMVVMFTALGTISQIFILLIGDQDKGMLASMGVIMLTAWGLAYSLRDADPDLDGFETFMNAAETLLPYSPFILAGLFALLFAALYFIYKRREK